MTPLPFMFQFARREFDPGRPSAEFAYQWKHPGNVFAVLLILGGDVVARALAQLVGSRLTPVAFSFGWVAYATTAAASATGENKLMPLADISCKVINGETGYVRDNCSWIIGRMVRDFEMWMDKQPRVLGHPALPSDQRTNPVQTRVNELIELKWLGQRERARDKGEVDPQRPRKAGLCVSVYRAKHATKGCPGYDAPYVTGFLTYIIQLGLAAIPCGLFGDWSILLVTAAGIGLCLAWGALPQWYDEKWACRTNTNKTIVLTRGNGSQHAIVIQGAGCGLDLEDLAAVDTGAFMQRGPRLAPIVLGAAWIILLITASAVTQNTWFLLAVGGVGIIQNLYVAGTSRPPQAFGLALEFVEVIGNLKCMDVLFEVENRYPGLGKSMLSVFFTGQNKISTSPAVASLIDLRMTPTVKAISLGGEVLREENVVNAYEAGVRLFNIYGPSEACIDAIVHRNVVPGVSPRNIGRPMSSQVWIVSPLDPRRLVPPGCPGELALSGTLARGYFNDEAKTERSFLVGCGGTQIFN
ncbi:Protein kinase-like domain protein [Purpureocillium lavendulum]|uniref:Protein kinase-like domain protein n=1 Tax=Purpureocillium lavendulum TaxID=1247861 RepID=A0AB34FBV3_9HYPO|nr:Protein kinase-like domain protein [Purpureocillium lavendulum]